MSGDPSVPGIAAARNTRRTFVGLFVDHLSAQVDVIKTLVASGDLEPCGAVELIVSIEDCADALGKDDRDLIDALSQKAGEFLADLMGVDP